MRSNPRLYYVGVFFFSVGEKQATTGKPFFGNIGMLNTFTAALWRCLDEYFWLGFPFAHLEKKCLRL